MNASFKKELILEGLCCGNCAANIERDVKRLDGVMRVSVDFVAKALSIEVTAEESWQEVMAQTQAIVKQHEPDIVIVEKASVGPGRKILYFSGLDCADCAAKIEAEVSRIDGVTSAALDFVSQMLTIEAVGNADLPRITRQAAEIMQRIEPGLSLLSEASLKGEKKTKTNPERLKQIMFGAGAVFFGIALVLKLPLWAEMSIFLTSYLLIGGEIVLRAVKNISRGQVFDENFLMSVATIGAFAIGEFPEGVAVMLFYQIGEFFQNMAVNRSRKSITALMDIRPDFANLKLGDEVRRVTPDQVGVDDLIVIKPGEKIPLDGTVVGGESTLDTSALTGESLPREVTVGGDVLSGSINKNGLLTVKVTKEFGESTVSKILDLVQHASSQKAPTENFITKFARYYTPFVVFAAVALAVIPPLVLPGAVFAEWINRALVFLVVSCPCALVVSIPLSFFGGIGGASKNGILVKGSSFLEALNNVDTVVFDKTGTLTQGIFKVTKIVSNGPVTDHELLQYAAYAESNSNHPIALSIRKAYGRNIDQVTVSGYEEIAGHGLKVKVGNHVVLAGNSKLMKSEGLIPVESEDLGTVVHLAMDGDYAGYILIADEVKPDSEMAIKGLRSLGVRRMVMLTGDSRLVAEAIGRSLGLDQVYAELLPHQKVEQLKQLAQSQATRGKLVFVGDGINDAPVLARADVGVAMGGLGSDAAIEAADVVLMTDEPSKLAMAIRIAKRTRHIVWQNIIFALGVKAVILVLGAGGIATMWEAVFGDVGVAVIAILNAMRVMKTVAV